MRVWVKNGLKRCHRVTDISRNPNAADEAGFCRSFCDLSFQNWFQLRRCENIAMEERGELLHGTAALWVKTKSHFLLTLQGWKPCQNQMNQGNDSEFLSLPEDELKLSLRLRSRLECKERCQSPSWGCQQPTGPALTADSTTEIFHIYRESENHSRQQVQQIPAHLQSSAKKYMSITFYLTTLAWQVLGFQESVGWECQKTLYLTRNLSLEIWFVEISLW